MQAALRKRPPHAAHAAEHVQAVQVFARDFHIGVVGVVRHQDDFVQQYLHAPHPAVCADFEAVDFAVF